MQCGRTSYTFDVSYVGDWRVCSSLARRPTVELLLRRPEALSQLAYRPTLVRRVYLKGARVHARGKTTGRPCARCRSRVGWREPRERIDVCSERNRQEPLLALLLFRQLLHAKGDNYCSDPPTRTELEKKKFMFGQILGELAAGWKNSSLVCCVRSKRNSSVTGMRIVQIRFAICVPIIAKWNVQSKRIRFCQKYEYFYSYRLSKILN